MWSSALPSLLKWPLVASVGSGIASQLQMFLILSELGAEPSVDHRRAVFLTHALTGWEGAATMEASLS